MSWFSRLIGKVNSNAFHHALRSTAKAQLNAIYSIRQGFPNLSNEELYHQVLLTPSWMSSTASRYPDGHFKRSCE